MAATLQSAAARNARAQYHHLAHTLRGLEEDLRWGLDGSDRIPAAWHAIAQQPAVPFKRPMTIRVDEDVARFFMAMGRGHLTRMNAVLRAFMQARLAGVVKGAEAVAYEPTALEQLCHESDELVRLIALRDGLRKAGGDLGQVERLIERRLQVVQALGDEVGMMEEAG